MTTQPEAGGRRTVIKTLIPLVVLLALVIGALTLVKSQLPDKTQNTEAPNAGDNGEFKVGAVTPDFVLHKFGTKADESGIKLSELKGKVYLVNFWASWCTACMIEMPSIVQLQKSFGSKGLEIVAVNVDEKPEAVLPKTLKEMKIEFPVYVDRETKLSELFDVHAIPLTVILDSQRKVLMIHNGELDWNSAEIRGKMEQWLANSKT